MGFEIVADGVGQRVVAHVVVEILYPGGVEPHRAQPGAPRKWAAFPAKDLSARIEVVLVYTRCLTRLPKFYIFSRK